MYYYDQKLDWCPEWNMYVKPVNSYSGPRGYTIYKTYQPIDVTGKFCGRLCELLEREANKLEKGYFSSSNWGTDHEPTPAERKEIEKLRYHARRYYERAMRHYTN